MPEINPAGLNLDFSRNSVQKAFVECGAKFQLASGGFGSGKSYVCCAKLLLLGALMPGSTWMVLRKTYPDLRDSTRKTFLDLLPDSWVGERNVAEGRWKLKNGTEYIFRHFEEGHVKVGSDLTGFFVDQAEEASEEIFTALVGRLRHHSPRHYGFLAMNPNGFDWQWKLFVKEPKVDYAYFNFPTEANRANLPAGYIEGMLSRFPKDWVERYVFGNWTSMSGLILHEFDDAANQCDPFDVPRGWPKARGLDWGVDAPSTAVPLTRSPEGVYYQMDEYGDTERTAEEHAKAILGAFKTYEPFKASILDASAFNREKDLKSVADEYRRAGLYCQPATRDQLARIMLVKTLLKNRQLVLFRGRCERTVEEVKAWKWGPRKGGREVPAAGNDHFLDAQGYAVYWMAYRGMGEVKAQEQKKAGGRPVGNLTINSGHDFHRDPVTGIPLVGGTA